MHDTAATGAMTTKRRAERRTGPGVGLQYPMEASMRPYLMLSGCVLAGAMLLATPAMADWHSPYVYRETNGSWTNVQYDDGVCHYYYSHNTYDQNTKLDRWGDCSHIVIGPDGVARQIYVEPSPAAGD